MKKMKRFVALGLILATMAMSKTAYADTGAFTQKHYTILSNIIGAVESGGQVYGKKDYGAYAGALMNSPAEFTCTIGWAQCYGEEARELIKKIYQLDKSSFESIDSNGLIKKRLNESWVEKRWNPNSREEAVIRRLIVSDAGKKAQDMMFQSKMKTYVDECKQLYTDDVQAVMMYCEVRHLGGKKPAVRIFNRAKDYSVDGILASLKLDQEDTSSSNQVGDRPYWSRHEACAKWIKMYVREEAASSSKTTGKKSSTKGQTASATKPKEQVSSGKAVSIPKSSDNGIVYVYRLYNPNSGEHFYTADQKEALGLARIGWDYEDVGWKVREKSSEPVYRLYNPNEGDHYYTTDWNECRYLDSIGWNYEKIAFYSAPDGEYPIYRQYNPNAQRYNHNYTKNVQEHEYLVRIGWQDENIAWYAVG